LNEKENVTRVTKYSKSFSSQFNTIHKNYAVNIIQKIVI